ncbi:MAG: cell wall-binding repeat-containing protein, partial [Solirubrobacterales bacterium]|nr:cell wall-binding repeat-containing protein [Solirubrobacterales bacterium]
MRRILPLLILGSCAALAACGGSTTKLVREPASSIQSGTPQAAQKLGFPDFATKNTTRVAGGDPIADAAGVARAVYPSAAAGSHPAAVTLAPTDDWQAAIASSVLMAPPIGAPILLSGGASLPSATASTLAALAPTGSSAIGGNELIRVGDVPRVSGMRASSISASGPFALAAAIDQYVTAATGKPTSEVVVASADNPAYAMPAAGWAAESGDPVLFVTASGIPAATKQALLSHQHPHIYVLGPPRVIPDKVIKALGKYGPVKRVGASDPASNSVAFAIYRDPPCAFKQPCAHVPGSFGWALRSPGHG